MKRLLILTVLMSSLTLGVSAQDDLYFTPSKSDKGSKAETVRPDDAPAYYSGSSRDVDEYNRRGKLHSYYQKIGSDSLGNDIIAFHPGSGVYPDTLVTDTVYPGSSVYYDDDYDDYAYSRRMGRFDGFYGWYNPYFYGYWGGPYWSSYWYDPWYYGSYWGWGGYYGWYDPWYYGWGWSYPGWGWGRPAYGWHGHTGTRGHSFGGGRSNGHSVGTPQQQYGRFGNGRSSFGNRTGGTRTYSPAPYQGNRNGGFRGTQPYNPNRSQGTRSYTPSRQSAPARSSYGGTRSFGGGSHSFGGGGGSRSVGGGGGHFGGGHR